MKNLATQNATDFTVTESGDAFISQTAVSKLCGVGQDAISKHIVKTGHMLNINSINQLGFESLELVIGHYAFDSQRTNDVALNSYRTLAKAGAKAYIYHEAGYVMEAKPIIPPQTSTDRLSDIEKSIQLLGILGTLDDRDRLHYSDSIRNATQALLPTSTEILPVTISTRVQELGLSATNGQYISIGSIAAKLYLDEYNEPPVKHTQYVGGAARNVNSYTTEHLTIIDEAIKIVLEGD